MYPTVHLYTSLPPIIAVAGLTNNVLLTPKTRRYFRDDRATNCMQQYLLESQNNSLFDALSKKSFAFL